MTERQFLLMNPNSTAYTKIYDVFISYRREGGETMAILLHDRLAAKGYSVFLDVESLNAGQFNSQLLQVIKNCKDFIVILSENALDRCVNEDDWVRQELACAFSYGKNIVPFMLRGFNWNSVKLPVEISDLPLQNGVNANSNEYFDASIERLAEKFLQSVPGEAGNCRTCNPKPQKSKLPLVFAVGITAFAVLTISIYTILGGFLGDGDGGSGTEPLPVSGGQSHSPGNSGGTESSQPPEILDKDYSDRAVRNTISANYFGVAAVTPEGGVVVFDIDNDVSNWSNVVSVSVGYDHLMVLKADGTVVAIGDNQYRQCDLGSWSDIIAVSAGSGASFGLRRNGTVDVEGLFGHYEQLSALRDVVAIAAGRHHLAALKADGTVEVIGNDSRGEHMTSGWSDITAIAADDFYTIGLKSDGSVVSTGQNVFEHEWDDGDGAVPSWCADMRQWSDMTFVTVGGANFGTVAGVRGDGSVVITRVPTMNSVERIQVIGGWSDITAVAVAGRNIVGLKSDGSVVYTRGGHFDDIDEVGLWSVRVD